MQATVDFRNLDLTVPVQRQNGTPLAYNMALVAFARGMQESIVNIDDQLADLEVNIGKIAELKNLHEELPLLTPASLSQTVLISDPRAGMQPFGGTPMGSTLEVSKSIELSARLISVDLLKTTDLNKLPLRHADLNGQLISPTNRYHESIDFPVPPLNGDYSSQAVGTSKWYHRGGDEYVRVYKPASGIGEYDRYAYGGPAYKEFTAADLDATIDDLMALIDPQTDRLSQVSQFKQAYIQDQATVNESLMKMATNLLQHMESTGQAIVKAM